MCGAWQWANQVLGCVRLSWILARHSMLTAETPEACPISCISKRRVVSGRRPDRVGGAPGHEVRTRDSTAAEHAQAGCMPFRRRSPRLSFVTLLATFECYQTQPLDMLERTRSRALASRLVPGAPHHSIRSVERSWHRGHPWTLHFHLHLQLRAVG